MGFVVDTRAPPLLVFAALAAAAVWQIASNQKRRKSPLSGDVEGIVLPREGFYGS